MSWRQTAVVMFAAVWSCVVCARSGVAQAAATAVSAAADKTEDRVELLFSGSVRLRYEGLEGQYRADPDLAASDHVGFSRVLLRAELRAGSIGGVGEVIDAREFFGGLASRIGTDSVSTVDLIQGFVSLEDSEEKHRVQLGRQTMRFGSERLIARQIYRNTINTFTGVDYRYRPSTGTALRAFWMMPVRRLPERRAALLDGRIEWDRESIDQQFFGLAWRSAPTEDVTLEAYGFGLIDRQDRGRRRRLYTLGARALQAPTDGELDYEAELIGQLGRSQSGSLANLDHRAWLVHASVGYTVDCSWRPRVRLALDVASGDRDPSDGSNERFDDLFGAQRFDFGPTGIYGAIARANIFSPEVRLGLQPTDSVRGFVAARSLWVHRAEDAVPRGGIRDPSGGVGREIGQQLEGRIQWSALPGALALEIGGAYLFAGDLLTRAPNARGEDVAYFYLQSRWSF